MLQINDIDITSVQHATSIISTALKNNDTSITLHVHAHEKGTIHPDEGVPMLYFDQLATIHDHLHNIKHDQPSSSSSTSTINKLDASSDQSSKYCLQMIQSFLQHGTIKAVRAILPKNKR